MKKVICAFGLLFIYASSMGQNLSIPREGNDINFYDSKEKALKAAGLDLVATIENDTIINESLKKLPNVKISLGESYGGYWVEYDQKNTAKIVFGVKNSNKIDFRRHEFGENVSFRDVTYSYKELENFKSKISKIFEGLAKGQETIILGIGVDYIKNKIIVSGLEKDQLFIQSILRDNLIPSDAIEMEVKYGRAQPAGTIFGGTKLLVTDPSSTIYKQCTAGFNVLVDVFYPAVITSGHCRTAHPFLSKVLFDNGVYIGYFFANEFYNNIDAVLVANENFAHTAPAKILASPPSTVSVKPLGYFVQGGPVCSFGSTTGWRCGTQLLENYLSSYLGGSFNLTRTSFCGAGGDSGGPVVTGGQYNQALGIFAAIDPGSNSTCGGPVFGGSGVRYAYYQSLTIYLSRYQNVQIKTE